MPPFGLVVLIAAIVSPLRGPGRPLRAYARELGISRALLQVHLRKLAAAGLVSADIEVSPDGKAMKFYEVTPFKVLLTPEVIEAATRTLTAASDLPTLLA